MLQSHSQMQKPSGTERGEDVGILSLPVELLQHIFMHVPLRQMARYDSSTILKKTNSDINFYIIYSNFF